MRASKPYYSLNGSTAFFIGRKPERMRFADGRDVPVKTWRQAVQMILQDCNADTACHEKLLCLCDTSIIGGRKRGILCSDPAGMDSPMQIGDSLYFEGHFGTEYLLLMTRRTLDLAGYDYTGIHFQLRERELDLCL